MDRTIIKRYSLVILLDLIFTFGTLFMLWFARLKTKILIEEMQTLTPKINEFLQQYSLSNVTDPSMVPYLEIEKLDLLANHAFTLNTYIAPIIIVLLFIATQMLVWKLLNKTPIYKFILYSIVPIMLALFTLTTFITYLTGSLNFEAYPLYPSIILLVSTILTSYIAMILLNHSNVKYKKLWPTLKKRFMNIKKAALSDTLFLVNIITAVIYVGVIAIALLFMISDSFNAGIFFLIIAAVILVEISRHYFIKYVR